MTAERFCGLWVSFFQTAYSFKASNISGANSLNEPNIQFSYEEYNSPIQ